MYRSETMSLNQIMFARESMWDTMNFLSYSEKVMFNDKNIKFKSKKNNLSLYASKMLKRTDDLFNSIDQIEKSLEQFQWPISTYEKTAKKYIFEIDKYCEKNSVDP